MTDNLSTVDPPRMNRLDEASVETIHEASVTILEEMGIKVDHEEGQRLLAENGCSVDDEGMVTFPRSLVEDCVDEAPANFTLHGRGEGTDVDVGGDDYVLVPSGGPPNVVKYDEDRRPSRMEDYEEFVKLAHVEDVVQSSGLNICEPNDVDQSVKHVEMMLRNLTLSDMPPQGSTYGADRAEACIEMVGIANDDPDVSKPYLAAVANSVSPRTWDTKMTGGLLTYARHGQPVVASPAVMAAASGPATLAGAMALANAEILAGVTMAQLANPGTPVVYGLPSSNVDVRYGSFAIGSPEGALFVSFAGQMARHYGIPSRAGGGLTDAKTMDDQQGSEAMLQLLTTMTSGINYVLHAAGVLDSYSTASPEKFVLDCDRIRYVQRFVEGFDVDEETLALDLIEEVEPGQHFLNKRHTLEHSKSEFLIPEVYDRDSYDNWESAGEKTAYELAHERVEELLDEYERPPIDEDVEHDLERYVEEKREEILR
ncbi:trimethylamine methyltransferase family protein [Halomicrococcus gelatinilyticus]|uniref:trimethylamine methyltransferase family protein n=1 Tax=Halomicrococcus gelatinilyticus TaxID=1702103 RepID=UPI002E0EAE70